MTILNRNEFAWFDTRFNLYRYKIVVYHRYDPKKLVYLVKIFIELLRFAVPIWPLNFDLTKLRFRPRANDTFCWFNDLIFLKIAFILLFFACS